MGALFAIGLSVIEEGFMRMKVQLATVAGAVALLCGSAMAQVSNQSGPTLSGPPEDISAAVIANNELATGLGTIQIHISHWSTDADRTRLLTALRESGHQALLKELQNMPAVGTIRTPNSVGYDLHYARQSRVGDGRRIAIATDRPIQAWEATAQPRSIDYPFTIIQMQLDNNGKGTGTMSYATKVVANDDIIELEDLASTPFRLTSIEAKPSKK
jgi:hypothetical protein